MGSDLFSYLVPGSWVSGETIALSLGISRAAVSKRIRSLRTKGYIIESSTKKGYRLAKELEFLDPDQISEGLDTKFIGRDVWYFEEVGSTNRTAQEIASRGEDPTGCKEGTVVLAEMQTSGKGRMSRPWLSPPGGVYMSLILKPDIPISRVYRINMAVSLAITKALFSLYGLQARIKWPNDILVEERKICGILMEVNAEIDRLKYAIVGIGINANIDAKSLPAEWNATSLSAELGHDISRIKLIQRLLHDIEEAYINLGKREIYLQWRERSATLGRNVRITSQEGDLEGEAVALSEDGTLEIRVREEIRRVMAGDCIHLRAK